MQRFLKKYESKGHLKESTQCKISFIFDKT